MCGWSMEKTKREKILKKVGASDIIPHVCMMNDLMKSSVDNEYRIKKKLLVCTYLAYKEAATPSV